MIAIKEQNKVFELIDFLFENIEKIKTFQKFMEKYDTLNDEMKYLKPKNELLDDAEYQKKKKEFDDFLITWNRIKKTYNDKINSFEFSKRYSFKSEFESILNGWIENIIEKGDAESKNNALKEIRIYKSKFKALQTEIIRKFTWHLSFSTQFDDLDYILNGSIIHNDEGFFSKYIQPKYSGLSKALQDYLEGVNDEVIESIIDEHKLPHGADKPQWIKNVDAVRFGRYVGLEYSQLREIFDNDVRANNAPKSIDKNDEIKHILSQHKVPKA